jgi:hypothetical protein
VVEALLAAGGHRGPRNPGCGRGSGGAPYDRGSESVAFRQRGEFEALVGVEDRLGDGEPLPAQPALDLRPVETCDARNDVLEVG